MKMMQEAGLFATLAMGIVVAVHALGSLGVAQPNLAPPNPPGMMVAEAEAADTGAVPAASQTQDTAAAQVAETTAPALASSAEVVGPPDAKAGKTVFAKCKACHAIDKAGKNGVGPILFGVVNRPIASVAGYKYSAGMTGKSAETWTPQLLDTYLKDVKGTIKGTKMAFAGLPKAKERIDLIAYLAENSDSPISATDLGLAAMVAEAPAPAGEPSAAQTSAAEQPAAAEEASPSAVVYADPPPQTAEEQAAEASAVEALKKAVAGMDHQRAKYHPLHFKPAIDTATNGECLACHHEVLDRNLSEKSPAGVDAAKSLAWYQTLATYDGPQMNFHQRHMTSPYAKAVMNLKCTFCHQGNDPREESPHMTVAAADLTSNNGSQPFTLRKMVNPTETCLRCHGAMPDPVNIMGLAAPWPEARKDLETPEAPNGCLSCHQELFRTNRHNVSYLNAATIEDLATESSDVCYGCHGGRAWYMIPYKYPRHPWPGMDASTVPDWAKDRKTESDPRYQIKAAQ
jgi:cytochrome c2